MMVAHTELLLQIIEGYWVFLNAKNPFYEVKTALIEGVIELILNFVAITLWF